MRVRFSDSEQWSSPVKPPRSQNYVKPHDGRARPSRGSRSMSWWSQRRAWKLRRSRPHAAADTNAVHDRLLQSMRVRLPGSGQWYSSVKPHDFTSGSQNYVRPHNGRARVLLWKCALSGNYRCGASRAPGRNRQAFTSGLVATGKREATTRRPRHRHHWQKLRLRVAEMESLCFVIRRA